MTGEHNQARRRPGRMLVALLACVVAAFALAACGSSKSGSSSTEGSTSTTSASGGSQIKSGSLLTDGTITYGTDFTEPPYESIINGQQQGFDVEFGKLLAQQLGLKPQFLDNRFATLIPALAAHKFDVILSSMYITAERLRQVDFVPYLDTGDVIVVKKGGAYQPKTALDVCGHTFSINSGAAVASIASGPLSKQCKQAGKQPINVKLFPSDLASLQEVAAGRADVTFVDPALLKSLQTTAGRDLGLEVSSAPGKLLYPVAVGIAVRQSDPTVKAALTAAIQRLDQNGQLAALRARYAISPPSEALVKQAEQQAAGQ